MRSKPYPYWRLAACLLLAASGALAQPDALADRSIAAAEVANGRALYQSACDACHSQNIHWRDKRLAKSWDLLVNEVSRWQRNAGRRWDANEIRDVAAYLNERFYQLPCPPDECADKQAMKGQ